MHVHSCAAVVATGDELVLGQTLDTNSKWISGRLLRLGIPTVEHVTLGDDRTRLAAAIRRLAASVPLVILTGGLGPTPDDLTREALSDVLAEPLVIDDRVLAALQAWLSERGREVTPNQRLQAMRPPSARSLDNRHGTAPGLHAILLGTAGGSPCDLFCLPGPPGELASMFDRSVLPLLRAPTNNTVRTRLLHLAGIAESDAAARLGSLMDRERDPLVGITASGAVLTVRIRTAQEPTQQRSRDPLDVTEEAVRAALAPHVFGAGDDSLQSVVNRLLVARHERAVVVESCTGGLLGKLMSDLDGSSSTFAGGWITYANELKVALLGVDPRPLEEFGAVSEQVAAAMAFGGLARAAAASPTVSHCLAITGVAGAGTATKPQGTVFIARASIPTNAPSATANTLETTSAMCVPPLGPTAELAHTVEVRRFRITGNRDDVRLRSARMALTMLYFHLTNPPGGPPRLLWESRG